MITKVSVFDFNAIQADTQKLREIDNDNTIDYTIIINDKTLLLYKKNE